MNFLDVIILGIIEGITEFLPISSTGHMILASSLLGIGEDSFVKTFEISIQLGAIAAIVFLYARNFLNSVELYKKLTVSFFPTALIGFLLYGIIKEYFFNSTVVSLALIGGGMVLLLVDKKIAEKKKEKVFLLEKISYQKAFLIGLVQGISVVPGISRAAATIIGGMASGLSKKQSMEFSFLLAVPTMLSATGYDLLRAPLRFSNQEIAWLFIGGLVSFVFAWITVKIAVNLVEKYGFSFFAYYRIILGLIFLFFSR